MAPATRRNGKPECFVTAEVYFSRACRGRSDSTPPARRRPGASRNGALLQEVGAATVDVAEVTA